MTEEFKFCTMTLIDSDDDIFTWQCSNCKKLMRFTQRSPSYFEFKFCPYCGATIDKEVRDD